MKNIEKFGKSITYSVDGVNGSWMLVEEGGDKWLHVTQKDMDMPDFQTQPLYLNRKGMWDLLVHFGCDASDKEEVFRKK